MFEVGDDWGGPPTRSCTSTQRYSAMGVPRQKQQQDSNQGRLAQFGLAPDTPLDSTYTAS